MKRNVWIFLIILSLVAGATFVFAESKENDKITLWPEIEPFYTDYFKVSDIHEIYYELCGNPNGTPVFVLHGGPGGSCSPKMRRFFNPDKFLIVMHDQRGAGQSKPFADIRDNTTQHLVEDIERLRKLLNLEQMILFGGSWGSTLGLAYAETYPKNVCGMVLRGIFTATQEEIDHFYHGGVYPFFPETYEKLVSSIPEKDRRPLPNTLLKEIQSDNAETRKKYSMAWAKYEIKISVLEIPDKEVDEILENYDPTAFSLIENYYMANGCFLEEGQLLKQANKIRNIPLTMVNGRYDMICPPVTAYKLHKKLPNSKLVIVEGAGHWMGDKPIERALLKAMIDFE